MSGHEIPGCFPESVCDACTAELARLQAIAAAAEALVAEGVPEADGPWCAVCGAEIRGWRDSVKYELPHEADCSWQALVRAVRGGEKA